MRTVLMVGYTIYAGTSDFPRHVVIRPWRVFRGEWLHDYVGCLCESLEEARASIPVGYTRIERDPTDDPVIVESWI